MPACPVPGAPRALVSISATLAAALCIVPAPADAQIKTDKKLGPLKPAPEMILTQRITLNVLPRDMERLDGQPGWTLRRLPNAGNAIADAGAAVYVERSSQIAISQSCRNSNYKLHDTFDLSRFIANGFRMASYRVEPAPPPNGFKSNPSSLRVQWIGNDKEYSSKRRFTLNVIAKPLLSTLAVPGSCWSGYRLHITIEGPRGVSPYTGKREKAKPPN